ncbi:MAG: hypothetical protein Q8Q95_01340 [bacterium]|nr:hypothetical protein [bacterium]
MRKVIMFFASILTAGFSVMAVQFGFQIGNDIRIALGASFNSHPDPVPMGLWMMVGVGSGFVGLLTAKAMMGNKK